MTGDPIAIYTTSLTPTAAQLETEWDDNWRANVLVESAPYLFSSLSFDAFTNPTVCKLYVRDGRAQWGLVPDGAVTLTAVDPATGGVSNQRHFVGNSCSGFVWVSDHTGTAVCTRSTVN